MREPDEAIERVLDGLRGVEAPAGMEQRIVAELRARESDGLEGAGFGASRFAPSRFGFEGWWGVRAGFWAAGLAAVVVVGYVGLAGRSGGRGSAKVMGERGGAGVQGSAEASAVAGVAEAKVEGLGWTKTRVGVERRADARRTEVRRVGVGEVQEGTVGRTAEEVAMEEMRAPSEPAPELPLTEQERLLRKVVHRGDPEEVAMLNPEVRAARSEADKSTVRRFFETTATGGNE